MTSSYQMQHALTSVDQIQDLAEKQRTLWQDALRRFRKNWLAVIGLIIVVLFMLLAILGPAIAPYDFLKQDIVNSLKGPTPEHPLGTDQFGRDIFSRLIYG